MKRVLKTIAARLPLCIQQELKRIFFAYQIRRNRFFTDEKEFAIVDRLISPGDWVLGIGANIGQYTKRFFEPVGDSGRVIAFEPVPQSFELLTANAQRFRQKNVTLFNAAASNQCVALGMAIPTLSSGLSNYYAAHLALGHPVTPTANGLTVLTFPIGNLLFPHSIRLAKIDAEGHELAVLRGMENLLRRDQPTVIVETFAADVEKFLLGFGYRVKQIPGSSNKIFSTTDIDIH